jgi:hypothetical protein
MQEYPTDPLHSLLSPKWPDALRDYLNSGTTMQRVKGNIIW